MAAGRLTVGITHLTSPKSQHLHAQTSKKKKKKKTLSKQRGKRKNRAMKAKTPRRFLSLTPATAAKHTLLHFKKSHSSTWVSTKRRNTDHFGETISRGRRDRREQGLRRP
ncbi:hypothetical protein ISCGN_010446 [Ixodes scapularis]